MTMTRQIKTRHTAELITAATTGYCKIEFASPRLLAMARADRGHCRMTAREYLEHRMSRGQMPECRLDLAIELRGKIRRMQRTVGGRRITGRRVGTKKPVTWFAKVEIERAIIRK